MHGISHSRITVLWTTFNQKMVLESQDRKSWHVTAFVLFLCFERPGVILFRLALEPKVQQPDTCEVSQAHFRNGSSNDVFSQAYDWELTIC